MAATTIGFIGAGHIGSQVARLAITTDGQPAGSKNRRTLVIAGDDPAAKVTVTKLIDECGFDVVAAGPLKEGWRIQRDTPTSNCGFPGGHQ